MLLQLRVMSNRFSLRFVPSHLRLVYWADITLILSGIGLMIRFLGVPEWPQAVLSGGALAGVVALMLGWATNWPEMTKRGAAIMAAVWGGQLTYLYATFGDQIIGEVREIANLVLGFAFFNLAMGMWWPMAVGSGERGVRWILNRSPSD